MVRVPLKRAVLAVAVTLVTYSCGGPPEDPSSPAVVYPPCAPIVISIPHTASPMQQSAVLAGLELWNARGLTQLKAAGEGSAVPLTFQRAAPFFHGFYDPKTGEVYVNETLTDPHEIAVVVAHELGHAMGLPHVEPRERTSVMNPGNLEVTPTPADNALLSAGCNVSP